MGREGAKRGVAGGAWGRHRPGEALVGEVELEEGLIKREGSNGLGEFGEDVGDWRPFTEDLTGEM